MKKLAVTFPGIGYTNDKPLLYYSAKLAKKYGFEVINVTYSGFKKGMRGNSQLMKEAAESAYLKAEEDLKDIFWEEYDEVLFISKSVGTVVAAWYMRNHKVDARSISYTPVDGTFPVRGEGIMFHGTSDPWVENESTIRNGCLVAGHELVIIPDGNHSLETGNVMTDIRILHDVMEKTEEYIRK